MLNYQQEIIIRKAREHIQDLRNMLDDLMYRRHDSHELSNEEFRKIRNAYDDICSANDNLP